MHKEKEEAQYRSRGDLGVYDHSMLDGDMFLQVCTFFNQIFSLPLELPNLVFIGRWNYALRAIFKSAAIKPA